MSYGGRTLWALSDDGVHLPTCLPTESTEGDASVEENEEEENEEENATSAVWIKSFFEAYRAMDVNKPQNVSLLQASLKLAKSLHQAIVSQGVSIIIKQSIKTLRSFRLCILQDGANLHLFVHPDTLTRLGFWLIDALRDIVSEQHVRRMEEKLSLIHI